MVTEPAETLAFTLGKKANPQKVLNAGITSCNLCFNKITLAAMLTTDCRDRRDI